MEKGNLIDAKKLESLLLGKRVLDIADLKEFHNFLHRLWEQSEGFPEDFRQKIFALAEYFNNYIAYEPGPYRPTKFQVIGTLNTLLPKPVR